MPSLEHSVRLHEAPETYLELIQATANHIEIPAVHVEKDYWVTRVLKRLHESDYSEIVVFKGGTSLSKAHRLIERFSEDVDLALRRDGRLSDSRRRTPIRSIERDPFSIYVLRVERTLCEKIMGLVPNSSPRPARRASPFSSPPTSVSPSSNGIPT